MIYSILYDLDFEDYYSDSPFSESFLEQQADDLIVIELFNPFY